MSKRIAISMDHQGGLDGPMDARFGRAPYFLIVELENKEIVEVLKNTAAEGASGAGTGAAVLISEKNVDAVVSCRYGPKAQEALVRLGVEMWVAPEGIHASEALDRMASGDLERVEMMKVY